MNGPLSNPRTSSFHHFPSGAPLALLSRRLLEQRLTLNAELRGSFLEGLQEQLEDAAVLHAALRPMAVTGVRLCLRPMEGRHAAGPGHQASLEACRVHRSQAGNASELGGDANVVRGWAAPLTKLGGHLPCRARPSQATASFGCC